MRAAAHSVADYDRPEDDDYAPNGRNDHDWMKHTIWYSDDNRIIYKPVRKTPLTVDYIEPKVAFISQSLFGSLGTSAILVRQYQ